jgi:uncharacterized protein YlxW (UPF0749 family)
MDILAELDLAHSSLYARLSDLEELIRLNALSQPSVMLTQLAITRDVMAAHFQMEEKNGWRSVVLDRAPRLELSVNHLLAEHRELESEIEKLIEEAQSLSEIDAQFNERLAGWIARVRGHEARENRLLEDCFSSDIGAGD